MYILLGEQGSVGKWLVSRKVEELEFKLIQLITVYILNQYA